MGEQIFVLFYNKESSAKLHTTWKTIKNDTLILLSKKSILQFLLSAGSKEKARLTLFEQSELSRNLKKVANRVHTESWILENVLKFAQQFSPHPPHPPHPPPPLKSMLSEVKKRPVVWGKKRLEGPNFNIDFGGKGLGWQGKGISISTKQKGAILQNCVNTFVPHCSFPFGKNYGYDRYEKVYQTCLRFVFNDCNDFWRSYITL